MQNTDLILQSACMMISAFRQVVVRIEEYEQQELPTIQTLRQQPIFVFLAYCFDREMNCHNHETVFRLGRDGLWGPPLVLINGLHNGRYRHAKGNGRNHSPLARSERSG